MTTVLSWDQKMALMQGLGDVSLAMPKPFLWVVRHAGVFLDDGEDWIVPEGQCTNPYGAAINHWYQLVTANRVVSLDRRETVVWSEGAWQVLGPVELA